MPSIPSPASQALQDRSRHRIRARGGIRDQSPADGGAPDLELGLHEQQDVGFRCAHGGDGGEDEFEGR